MIVYRLYTESRENLPELVTRYFPGFTIYYGTGYYESVKEACAVIEVIGSEADRQNVIYLASDIRIANGQSSVMITWSPVSRFDVTEVTATEAQNKGAVYKVIGRNRETGQIVFDSSARRLSAVLSYLPLAEARSKARAMQSRFPDDDYTVIECPEVSS